MTPEKDDSALRETVKDLYRVRDQRDALVEAIREALRRLRDPKLGDPEEMLTEALKTAEAP